MLITNLIHYKYRITLVTNKVIFCNLFKCSFTDVERPDIINLPSNLTQNTDPSSNTSTVEWTPPTATDNSGENVSLTSTHSPGDSFDIGTTTVTYTAIDLYSNEATASFDVIVTGTVSLKLIKKSS